MRAQFVHLSGPRRGRTTTYDARVVTIGTEAGVTARYPDGTPGIVPRHAELEFVEEACEFYLRRLDGQVFVNNREVEEVIVTTEDLVEFGVGGPKIRFRSYSEDCELCKPVRVMMGDAKSVARASGALAGAQAITRDLFTQASLRLKVGFPLLVLAIALPLAWLAGWFGAGAGKDGTKDLERVNTELRQVVESLQKKLEQAESADAMSQKNIAELRAEFASRAGAVDRLVRDDSAARRVYGQLRQGVCLIHGRYGFRKDGKWLESPPGRPLFNEYVGSGFRVHEGGWIATNRHVAAPWVRDEDQAPLLNAGYQAQFETFRVFFPGQEALALDPDATVLRSDEVDVALIKPKAALPESVPVLTLDKRSSTSHRGERVLVVGYPTGINALLAKADPVLVDRVTSSATSLGTILDQLSDNGAISPLITGGSLNDVTVKRLVYDADTTSGGSGGPVFGRDGTVIGVNFAIVREFTGSNLGVPVEFLHEILKGR